MSRVFHQLIPTGNLVLRKLRPGLNNKQLDFSSQLQGRQPLLLQDTVRTVNLIETSVAFLISTHTRHAI